MYSMQAYMNLNCLLATTGFNWCISVWFTSIKLTYLFLKKKKKKKIYFNICMLYYFPTVFPGKQLVYFVKLNLEKDDLSKEFFFFLEESLSKRVFLFLGSKLGMAIWAWLAGTRSGPTLMERVLPDPIKNRVGFGF